MRCRKQMQRERRGASGGLLLQPYVCNGRLDDNGVCLRCGGVSGKRSGRPVERVTR